MGRKKKENKEVKNNEVIILDEASTSSCGCCNASPAVPEQDNQSNQNNQGSQNNPDKINKEITDTER